MTNKLPYSYIATQQMMQFTVALTEACKRIDHITNQEACPYFASLPDNITFNPFEADLAEYKKSFYQTIIPSVATDTSQLASYYNRIIFHGAQATYESCKESMDLYLYLADSAEYARDSHYLKTVFERYDYKNGQISKEAYIKTHGLHPDFMSAETIQSTLTRKQEMLQQQEDEHNDFNDKMMIAADLMQLHLDPRTRNQKSSLKRLQQKIVKVDQYVTNICGITHDPLPVALEPDYKQQEVIKDGRKALYKKIGLIKA